jgi:uncharacterized protein (DUF1697 family)
MSLVVSGTKESPVAQRFVVMPRGINVGAHNRVPMAGLRAALTNLGCTDVQTIGQSGNIVVTAEADSDGLAGDVRRLLADKFGTDVPCVVRTASQVQAVLAKNPLRDVADDPSRYLVTFLSKEPDAAQAAEVTSEDQPPEVIVIDGTEAYVWTPEGVRAMHFSYTYLEKKLQVNATARNWATVEKIAATLG